VLLQSLLLIGVLLVLAVILKIIDVRDRGW
jgi:hypothetical protein